MGYDDAIGEYAEKLKGKSMQELVRGLAKAKQRLEEAKEVKSDAQAEYDAYRLRVIPGVAEEEDITNITVDGAGRMNLEADVYASIVPGKQQQAFDWLEENGHGALIKPVVNAGSLKAMIKEKLKNGGSFPEELFRVTPFTRAKLTKTK